MAENYAFTVNVPDKEPTVEYRTTASHPETAIERAYSKYPDGEITSCISHDDSSEWDMSPPEDDEGNDSDDSSESGSNTSPTSEQQDTSDESDDSDDDVLAVDPTTLTVSEIREAVEDQPDEVLETALELEQDNDDRTTAVEAIEEAME